MISGGPGSSRGGWWGLGFEFDPQHADGIRHGDLMEGERVLNELIYECQRSL
jgi:hypothetical protein